MVTALPNRITNFPKGGISLISNNKLLWQGHNFNHFSEYKKADCNVSLPKRHVSFAVEPSLRNTFSSPWSNIKECSGRLLQGQPILKRIEKSVNIKCFASLLCSFYHLAISILLLVIIYNYFETELSLRFVNKRFDLQLSRSVADLKDKSYRGYILFLFLCVGQFPF